MTFGPRQVGDQKAYIQTEEQRNSRCKDRGATVLIKIKWKGPRANKVVERKEKNKFKDKIYYK